MDFLSNFAKGDKSKPTSDQPDNPDHQGKFSTSDIFASAKVVTDAAQAQLRNEPEKYDKAKVAGAGADLLGAASEYGKLDDTQGIGKYVNQAEDYLRKYDHSQSTDAALDPDSGEQKTTTTDAPTLAVDSGDDKTAPATTTTETTDPEKPYGGGAGDYVKEAEGFLNKPSDGAQGGGPGDYIKMAEGFLNKPSGDGGDEKSEPPSQSSEGGYGDLLKTAGGFFKK